MNVRYTKDNDPIVDHDGWRAAYIRKQGQFVLTARRPDGTFLFGLVPETGFLVGQKRKPTTEQVKAFLRDCIDGKIVDRTLEDLLGAATAS